jgi:large subunit ribosomal protein L17
MRHKRKTQNFSRFSSYFKATVNSLARAVLIHQRITTTKVRAKVARGLVEKLVGLGKNADSLAARRRAFSFLGDHALVHKLFSEIGPTFAQKNGGYTRIIPFKRRRGDNAELVILELSVRRDVPKHEKEKPAVKKEKDDDKKIKAMAAESVREHKSERKEVAPPEKEKHKKETQKPTHKPLGGFGKIFKTKRDSE